MQEIWENEKTFERQATEGYENMSIEEKNNSKYLVTFPYPYMNGYLHLGKFINGHKDLKFHNLIVSIQNLTELLYRSCFHNVKM